MVILIAILLVALWLICGVIGLFMSCKYNDFDDEYILDRMWIISSGIVLLIVGHIFKLEKWNSIRIRKPIEKNIMIKLYHKYLGK